MKILDVINDMLGTMGEAPLNALTEPHSFKGAGLRLLDKHNRAVQAAGWWFNRELLMLQPSAQDSRIYLPNDTINVRYGHRRVTHYSIPRPQADIGRNVSQRGRLLYDNDLGTDQFSKNMSVTLVRLVPFEDVPESAAQYIAAMAVLEFQTVYDGDSAKTRSLEQRVMMTKAEVRADETRNTGGNMLASNDRLSYIKSKTQQARRLLRG